MSFHDLPSHRSGLFTSGVCDKLIVVSRKYFPRLKTAPREVISVWKGCLMSDSCFVFSTLAATSRHMIGGDEKEVLTTLSGYDGDGPFQELAIIRVTTTISDFFQSSAFVARHDNVSNRCVGFWRRRRDEKYEKNKNIRAKQRTKRTCAIRNYLKHYKQIFRAKRLRRCPGFPQNGGLRMIRFFFLHPNLKRITTNIIIFNTD